MFYFFNLGRVRRSIAYYQREICMQKFQWNLRNTVQWFLPLLLPLVFTFTSFFMIFYASYSLCMCLHVHPWDLFPYFLCFGFHFVDLRASDMERERQDGSSPRGVIEACLTGLESNSDFTRNSTAESEVPRSKAHSNWSRFFKSWKRFSLKHLTSPPPVPKEPKRKSRSTRENTVLRNLYNFKSTLQHFTFAELKIATNNFNHGLYFISLVRPNGP
jgi:hypothetical protein